MTQDALPAETQLTPEELRLAQLAEFLEEKSLFPEDVASTSARAIRSFLNRDVESLGLAFGVEKKAKRGPPGNKPFRKRVAAAIFALRLEGTPWIEIPDALQDMVPGAPRDERDIRKLYAEHQNDLIAEAITLRLNDVGGGD